MLVCALYINERLVKNIEIEGEKVCTCSAIIWMVFFLLVTAGNVAWIVMMFMSFATLEDC